MADSIRVRVQQFSPLLSSSWSEDGPISGKTKSKSQDHEPQGRGTAGRRAGEGTQRRHLPRPQQHQVGRSSACGSPARYLWGWQRTLAVAT